MGGLIVITVIALVKTRLGRVERVAVTGSDSSSNNVKTRLGRVERW